MFNVVLTLLGQQCTQKILFIDLLIPLGQQYTVKIIAQCCSRGSRQHSTGKNVVQCYLNTLGTTLRR